MSAIKLHLFFTVELFTKSCDPLLPSTFGKANSVSVPSSKKMEYSLTPPLLIIDVVQAKVRYGVFYRSLFALGLSTF